MDWTGCGLGFALVGLAIVCLLTNALDTPDDVKIAEAYLQPGHCSESTQPSLFILAASYRSVGEYIVIVSKIILLRVFSATTRSEA